MLPVDIVQLDLHEVPMVFLMKGHELVPSFVSAMERESEVAYATGLALFHQEVDHAVVKVPLLEGIHSADAVQEVVVNVVRLKILK